MKKSVKIVLFSWVILSIAFLSACSLNTKTDVTVAITSNIAGFADTNNKSTLKETVLKSTGPGDTNIYYYNETGERVAYPDDTVIKGNKVTYTGSAQISLQSKGAINDHKIDSSQAVIGLVAGDGYTTDELILNNTKLSSDWKNGTTTYQLSTGDLEWTLGDYVVSDSNSGKEWSCFGGDGNGLYTFNLQVSGLKYDGKELEPQIFQVKVYIYGRDATDMAERYNNLEPIVATESSSGKEPSDVVQWTWESSGSQPNLADNRSDNIYITWTQNTSLNKLTQDDITITLTSEYGDTLTLGKEDYQVFQHENESQIAVTYRHWAASPVYTKMAVSVNTPNETVSETHAIASVYVNMVQTGGGGQKVDGTVTAYSYYGIANLESYDQVMNDATYTLQAADGSYYAENKDGVAYLTSDESEAAVFNAAGEKDMNQALVGNVAVITNRAEQSATKTVDGSDISFTKVYDTKKVNKSYQEMIEAGLVPAAGYVFPEDPLGSSMWAWQTKFQYGWTQTTPAPTTIPTYSSSSKKSIDK